MFPPKSVFFVATLLFLAAADVPHASAALVLHYTLDDSEPATTVLDSSGLGNNGTNNGQTFEVAGIDGTGIQAGTGSAFNSDRIEGPTSTTLGINGNSARTVSLWLNADSVYSEMAVLGFGAGSNRQQFIITVEDLGEAAGVGNSIALRYGSGNVGYNNGSDIVTGEWYHVAFVYDGTTLDFDPVDGTGIFAYINGALVSSVDGNKGQEDDGVNNNGFNTTSNALRIGNSTSDNRGFNGKIDDVQIYDTALTASEISFIYNNPGSPIPEPSSLLLLSLGLGSLFLKRGG